MGRTHHPAWIMSHKKGIKQRSWKKSRNNDTPNNRRVQWSCRCGDKDATVMGQLGGAPDNVPEVAAAGLTASVRFASQPHHSTGAGMDSSTAAASSACFC
eukprot:EG_transcript_28016